MDDIVFYQPPSASNSQPRLPGARTSPNVSGASSASFPVRQTAPRFNQRNDLSKDDMTKSRDVRDPSQKSHSDQRYRNDTVQMQENLTATRNPPDSDDDDDFPDIDELLSGMKRKSVPASADPNSDDNNNDDGDEFPDIGELLPGIKQKSVPACAKPNHGYMAEKVDNGTRGDSPPDSSRSTEGSTQDPIILSDDESTGTESETDYTDPDVDLTANSYPDSAHVADSELADGDGFGSRAALTSHCLVAGHQDDNDKNSGEIGNTQLRLSANRPGSASPSHGSVTYQASKQMDTDNIQGSTNLDVTKELEDEGSNVSVEGNDQDGDGTCSTKGRKLSAVSVKNPASDSNIPEQSPQPDLAAASPQESDMKNDHLPKRHRRRRTIAPIRLASTASAALGSSAEPQSRAQITALGREMVDDGSADDSDDGDYDDRSGAAGSQRGCRPRKRVRRTKDTEDDVAAVPTHSVDISCQVATATSSSSTQESEEIPICGYLTLKTIESKVVYCLTFSQELLPEPSGTWQRQDISRSVSSSSDKRDSERSPVQERAMSRPVRNSRFSSEDDALLLQLKGEGLSWDEISDRFPERSKGTLQVHYSTKLKRRSETSETMRKHRRNG